MNINEAAKSVYDYLEEIEQVLLEMEAEVNNLFSCDPEDIDVGVERINQYREIIDEIFADIRSVTDEDETGGLKLAVSPLTNRSEINDMFADVFEKRQDVNAVVSRIQGIIPVVEERMRRGMEKTLQEIRENNTSQSAQASKYYNAVNDSTNPQRLSQKRRSI